MQVSWVPRTVGGYTGSVREDFRDIFTDDFLSDIEAAVKDGNGRTIKDSRVRWAAIYPVPGPHSLFIKKYRVRDWKDRLKSLLTASKARKEWKISRAFRGKGVRIPEPVGVMEKRHRGFLVESIYISEAMDGFQPLMDFITERFGGEELTEEDKAEKRRHVQLLGDTVRRIHEGGLFHGDLHAGNFLTRRSGEGELYLIDLHWARMERALSRRQRFWNIAQLFYSLNSILDQRDKETFLEAYAGSPSQPLLTRVDKLAGRIQRRHQRSRVKRCLKESSLFTVDRWDGYRLYRRRDVSRMALMDMIHAHREIVENSPSRLLKNSPKTVVSMVETPLESAPRTCVKQYRWITAWARVKDCFRYSKGKASWIAANELFRKGISQLKPLGYIEKRHLGLLQESYFLMESPADYLEMDRFLIKVFGSGPSDARTPKKRPFIQEFAGCIGRLHREGIFHSDLKTCNILTRERVGGWDFSFIDLDAVHLGTEVNAKRALKNLVQINCSIPGFMGYGDRVRFLERYLEVHPIPMEKRDVVDSVFEESRKRGVVYVSPEGDVMEEIGGR
jgi:tRNA A-37 threonylcarbamoyl transferase component Bud32